MRTLTVSDKGRGRTRSLPSAAAVRVVREQIANHDRFGQWCKRRVELNEQIANQQLEEVLEEGVRERSRDQKNGGGGAREGDRAGKERICPL